MLTTAQTGQPKTAPRLYIPPDQTAPPVPCEECGYTALHVGRILDADGKVLATILVCTRCRARSPR
ncbi:hypothetical protein LWP59_32505 [Amycolatopsis acidiphila]|uniref:Uncharacterized protein n=1 Tax=Amycolatopsis acidiphila TaxID=715473 RepID=A0A558A6K9_9PSEU|nr:hypothetical protein [Amycolatopsis acidiphila]TVT19858.1 hypothetical protein FNH06_22835 [Amycolatopsis acidiphila]UIJ58768.1 hypothetical protein LWP59_32505 [Amycolatopsis acidiphila]GHG71820.1 hypothetical protein GCM10017788_33830 [Amycolatopsis acidiphila]